MKNCCCKYEYAKHGEYQPTITEDAKLKSPEIKVRTI